MCVVSQSVQARVQHRDATADVARGVIDQSFADWPGITPDLASRTCVQGISVIGRGREHNAVNDYRRGFHVIGAIGMKYPLRSQLRDIAGVDLIQATESSSRIVS